MRAENAKLEESLRAQESNSSAFMRTLSRMSLTCPLESKISHLERIVQELRNKLADSQRAANRNTDTLNETIKSLGASDEGSSVSIVTLTHISLKFTFIR